MKYDFDQKIAKEVGVEEAILHSNISWWCAKNKADKSKKHLHDGFYWTYSTEKAWEELFPFWTAKQISRIVSNLEKSGLLASEQFSGNDRTKWYRPITQTVSSNNPNGLMQEPERSDAIIGTDKNPDIKPTDIVVSTETPQAPQKNSFEEAAQMFEKLGSMIESEAEVDKDAERFYTYWTAPTKAGKARWRTEKTFAFRMRWGTWKERSGGSMNFPSGGKPARGTVG